VILLSSLFPFLLTAAEGEENQRSFRPSSFFPLLATTWPDLRICTPTWAGLGELSSLMCWSGRCLLSSFFPPLFFRQTMQEFNADMTPSAQDRGALV